jgi:hypothetical protein
MLRATMACAITLAALAVPTAASAAWTAPDDLSDPGGDAGQQEVAIDAAGDSIATWIRWDGTAWVVQARTRSAAGVLGFAPTLSAPGQDAFHPEVAVDPAGNATIVWSRFDGSRWRVQARTVSQFGVVGVTSVPVSDASVSGSEPQVGVDAAGNTVIAWLAGDGVTDRIQARTLSPAGVLGPVLEVSTPGRNTWAPQLAVAPTGATVLTWTEFDGTNERIYASTLSAAGVLGAPVSISAAGQDGHYPRAAIDAAGDARLVWVRFDGTDDRIQTRSLSAAGVRGAVTTLSDPGGSATFPQLSIDPAGNTFFAWQRFDGTEDRAQFSTLSAAGVFGAPVTVSNPGEPASDTQIAADAAGTAVVSYERSDGTNARVRARRVNLAGGFLVVRTLSDPGQNAFAPELAANGAGAAVVVWERNDGTDDRVQLSTGP